MIVLLISLIIFPFDHDKVAEQLIKENLLILCKDSYFIRLMTSSMKDEDAKQH